MLEVKSVTQTCNVCPSQWEGETQDGRQVYVRYRWGYLSVRVSDFVSDDITDAVRGDEVFGAELGDDLHGVLSYEELKRATAGEIQWPL